MDNADGGLAGILIIGGGIAMDAIEPARLIAGAFPLVVLRDMKFKGLIDGMG